MWESPPDGAASCWRSERGAVAAAVRSHNGRTLARVSTSCAHGRSLLARPCPHYGDEHLQWASHVVVLVLKGLQVRRASRRGGSWTRTVGPPRDSASASTRLESRRPRAPSRPPILCPNQRCAPRLWFATCTVQALHGVQGGRSSLGFARLPIGPRSTRSCQFWHPNRAFPPGNTRCGRTPPRAGAPDGA